MLTTKLNMPPDFIKALLKLYYAICILRYTAIDSQKPDQMGVILLTNFLNPFFVWKLPCCDLNFTEIYPKLPIHNKLMLVQIVANRRQTLAPNKRQVINTCQI